MYSPNSTNRVLFVALLLAAAALSALAEDSVPVSSTIRFKTPSPAQPARDAGEVTGYDEVDPSGQPSQPPLSAGGGSSRRVARREPIIANDPPSAAPERVPAAPPKVLVQPASHEL